MAGVFLRVAGRTVSDVDVLISKLMNMYARYAVSQGWRMEAIPQSGSSAVSTQEVAALITGENVFRKLGHEDGVHRFQWVPIAEQEGRVHTVKLTVSIAPNAGHREEVKGANSHPIRTYNIPLNQVTDHRIGLTLRQFDLGVDGDLEPIILALIKHFDEGWGD